MADSRDPRVPPWARALNPAQYARFASLVRRSLEHAGWAGTIGDGAVEARAPDGALQTFGLSNLLQVCRASPPDDWTDIVDRHFAALVGSRRAEEDGIESRMLASFDLARPALRVRLWNASYRDEVGADNLVCREDLPGVVTALVLDLPWSVRSLKPSEVTRWGRSIDELFAVGLANVRDLCPPEVEHVEPVGEASIVFLSSPDGDFFAASHALLLAGHPTAVGAHGALVGVPHRHMVVTHAIEDLRVVDAVNAMIPFVRRCFDEGPGSIDPDLFWFRDGRFVRLPCTVGDDGQLRFEPPAAFAAFVASLREER